VPSIFGEETKPPNRKRRLKKTITIFLQMVSCFDNNNKNNNGIGINNNDVKRSLEEASYKILEVECSNESSSSSATDEEGNIPNSSLNCR